jgi:hypothetical protein
MGPAAALLCVVAAPLLFGLSHSRAESPARVFEGEVRLALPRDEVSEAWYARMLDQTQVNIKLLMRQGRLAPATVKSSKVLGPGFSWPLKSSPGRPHPPNYFIVNYVDHDPVGGALQDYNCGSRTYDLASGGHRGTDIGLSPFSWQKMDNEEMSVIAAAPGVIVNKHDGEPDRTCGSLTSLSTDVSANFVVIRHADGTNTLYLHMKRGTLTPKNIGDAVDEGEFLGTVGSSGFSSGPHLHFEVRAANGTTIDPWQGACNTIAQSYWKAQEPYINPQLLAVIPSKANPVAATNIAPTCDTTTNTMPTVPPSFFFHPDYYFAPGEVLYITGWARDATVSEAMQFVVRRPDGSVFLNTNANTSSSFIANTGLVRGPTLPASAPVGQWTIAVTYAGQTKTVPIYVGVPQPASVNVVDYYNSTLKHYFRTANPDEVTAVDGGLAGPGWARTGDAFQAFARGTMGAGTSDVCRFYGSIAPGPNSHFYTAAADECDALKAIQAATPTTQPRWNYEEIAFSIFVPSNGVCPVQAPVPVYRLYNQRAEQGDSNHRYTTKISASHENIALGWSGEGVVMCAVGR